MTTPYNPMKVSPFKLAANLRSIGCALNYSGMTGAHLTEARAELALIASDLEEVARKAYEAKGRCIGERMTPSMRAEMVRQYHKEVDRLEKLRRWLIAERLI